MRDSLEEFEPGTSLDRYELLLPIAKGGMGRVWAARLRGSRGFQKLVAIKTILTNSSEDELFEQMLLEEATLASQIQHPNVAQCLDFGEHGGLLFLVMEWVDGDSLDFAIKRAATVGGFPLDIGTEIVAQACKGLHAAHELCDAQGQPLGLVHRDVSPQNLMVANSGTVKLVDFGIAKITQRGPEGSTGGEIKGKLSYMSPEQARGEVIDRRTDIFALGVVLYQLTTGLHPFRGATPVETLRRICSNEPVKKPSEIVAGYPSALDRVVLRALSRRPEDRFSTAAEMSAALEAAAPRAGEGRLGEFMRKICGQRARDRQTAIRDALKLADDRGDLRGRELSLSDTGEYSSLRAISVSQRNIEVDQPLTPAIPAQPAAPATPKRSRRRAGVIASALIGGALVAGLAANSERSARLGPTSVDAAAAPLASAALTRPAPPLQAPVAPVVASGEAQAEPPASSATQTAPRPSPKKKRAPKLEPAIAPAPEPPPANVVQRDPLERRR